MSFYFSPLSYSHGMSTSGRTQDCPPGSYLAVICCLRQVYQGREIDRIPFSRSPTTTWQRRFGDAERIPVFLLLVTFQLTYQPELQSTTPEGIQQMCSQDTSFQIPGPDCSSAALKSNGFQKARPGHFRPTVLTLHIRGLVEPAHSWSYIQYNKI
jgi:hypothetical protein